MHHCTQTARSDGTKAVNLPSASSAVAMDNKVQRFGKVQILRDNNENTLSLYNSRQLVRADRCCLIDEVRFLAPLGVVSSNVPSSRLFAASPLSVSLLFRGLPRFLTLAVVCAMPSVLSATSPPLRISIELLTPTCCYLISLRYISYSLSNLSHSLYNPR